MSGYRERIMEKGGALKEKGGSLRGKGGSLKGQMVRHIPQNQCMAGDDLIRIC